MITILAIALATYTLVGIVNGIRAIVPANQFVNGLTWLSVLCYTYAFWFGVYKLVR